MNTHNIRFYGEIRKIIQELSPINSSTTVGSEHIGTGL